MAPPPDAPMYPPIHYQQPVYRPPSEAHSLILQVTLGCSWNRCSFCEMYREKQFQVREPEALIAEIQAVAAAHLPVRRVFLADGDALALSNRRLLPILEAIQEYLPEVQRISAYAAPDSFLRRTEEEIKALRQAGLRLVYVGIESGDDEILRRINKNETAASTLEGLQRARAAEIKTSVMIISGLGGALLSDTHAQASARLLNQLQPEYASLLTLMLPAGEARFLSHWGEGFQPLSPREVLAEAQQLIAHSELRQTIFRSDHASNYLALKGTLGRDKSRLLAQIQQVLEQPDTRGMRPEWSRGL